MVKIETIGPSRTMAAHDREREGKRQSQILGHKMSCRMPNRGGFYLADKHIKNKISRVWQPRNPRSSSIGLAFHLNAFSLLRSGPSQCTAFLLRSEESSEGGPGRPSSCGS